MVKDVLLKVIERIDHMATPGYCDICKGVGTGMNINFGGNKKLIVPFGVSNDLFDSTIEELSMNESIRREYNVPRRLLTGAAYFCGKCVEAHENGKYSKAEKNKDIRRECLIEARNRLEKYLKKI